MPLDRSSLAITSLAIIMVPEPTQLPTSQPKFASLQLTC